MSKAETQYSPVVIELERALDAVRPFWSGCPRFIVACSGGRDSHTLLHALAQLREKEAFTLEVAHFDHALRQGSEEEAEFVRELAQTYGCAFHLERAAPKPQSENVEAWAREVRYQFLETVRVHSESALVLTAHHESDQSETMLFRILTGRALSDSNAIAHFSPLRKLLRPLLEVSRAAIEAYALEHELRFVEDPTNADRTRRRNFLRHEIIPALKIEVNPKLDSHLTRLSGRWRDDEAYLHFAVFQARDTLSPRPSRSELSILEPAIRWRMLKVLAREQVGAAAEQLGFDVLERVSTRLLCPISDHLQLELGFGIRLEMSPRGQVSFTLGSMNHAQEVPAELALPGVVKRTYAQGLVATISASVHRRNEFLLPSGRTLLSWVRDAVSVEQGEEAVAYFDVDKLGVSTLQVRERRDGDRMRVFARGERKLKQLFLERAVELPRREQTPVVESGVEILWVPGVARSELAPLVESTSQILELRCRISEPNRA